MAEWNLHHLTGHDLTACIVQHGRLSTKPI